jgi:Flp pilus assembly protein TadG
MIKRICGSIVHAPALPWRDRRKKMRRFRADQWRDFANFTRTRLRTDQGSNLVETALASMALFALLIGIFEFALGFYTYHYSSNAARQGSRYAIVRGSNCSTNLPGAPASFHCNASEADIAAYVKGLSYPAIDAARNLTVTVSTCAGSLQADASGNPTTTWSSCSEGTSNNDPGDQVQVTVTYAFPLAIPFWNQETVGISSTSSMVYSQ